MIWPDELTSKEIKTKVTQWQEEHGKLEESNFFQCLIHFVQRKDLWPDDIKHRVRHLIDESGVKHCSHCGRLLAQPKAVNGTVHLLCSCCRDSVLFQKFGLQGGYT